MLFNAATGYALQSLAAMPEDGRYTMAVDLAEQLKLPSSFLAKILQSLVRAGILESLRGPKGGFRLARPAHKITVQEVVEMMEGLGCLNACVMGFPACDPEAPCPMHDAWSVVKGQVESSMTSITVRDLQLARIRKGLPEAQPTPRKALVAANGKKARTA